VVNYASIEMTNENFPPFLERDEELNMPENVVTIKEVLRRIDAIPNPTDGDMDTVIDHLLANEYSHRKKQPKAKTVIKEALWLRHRYMSNTSGRTREHYQNRSLHDWLSDETRHYQHK
jgi:hypothetical protein